MPENPLASDNFNRSDGPLGANWDDGYSGFIALTIHSTTVCVASGAGGTPAVESYNGVSLPNNQYAQMDFSFWNPSSTQTGLGLRMAAPATMTFYLYLTANFGTVANEIYKVVANSYTQLAANASPSWAAGAVMKATVDGSTHNLWQDGVSILSASDSAITSGRAGIWCVPGSSILRAQLDNFVCGEITVGGGGGGFQSAWARNRNILIRTY